MNLDETQRQRVTAWILQGAKLSEIQSRLAEEFGLRLTYMEVRLLVADLKLTPKDPEPPQNAEPLPAEPEPAEAKGGSPSAGPSAATGKVSVSVDHVTRPGAIASGKVAFSDGQNADWYLDQMGRFAVVPGKQGYKPSATDVQQFQAALQNELARMGF